MVDQPHSEEPASPEDCGEPGGAGDTPARALRDAIVSVEAAVARVHEFSGEVFALAGAPADGDIVDHHNALSRAVGIVEDTGRLTAGDWEAVRGLGDVLAHRARRLRAHAGRVLDGHDADAPAPDRVACLQQAVEADRLGETLQLLVLVEDSLNLWQRLWLERIQVTAPDRADRECASARAALTERIDEDVALLLRARRLLASYAGLTPLDLVRRLSTAGVQKDIARLRADLDDVAAALGGAAGRALEAEDPAVAEGLAELARPVRAVGGALGDSARTLGERAVGAGTTGIGKLGRGLHRVSDPVRRSSPHEPVTTTDI